jgi:hypothetical protein
VLPTNLAISTRRDTRKGRKKDLGTTQIQMDSILEDEGKIMPHILSCTNSRRGRPRCLASRSDFDLQRETSAEERTDVK